MKEEEEVKEKAKHRLRAPERTKQAKEEKNNDERKETVLLLYIFLHATVPEKGECKFLCNSLYLWPSEVMCGEWKERTLSSRCLTLAIFGALSSAWPPPNSVAVALLQRRNVLSINTEFTAIVW